MSTAAPLQAATVKPVLFSRSLDGKLLQRKCACGSSKSPLGEMCEECQSRALQRKLAIGASNDPLEREADRVADQVLAAPAHHAVNRAPLSIQRFSGQSNGQTAAAPASVDRVLAGSGRPLEPALRLDMEHRFGHDFSQVRVHTGAAAEQSARDVNARAYTVGRNMVFGEGRFAPRTHEGQRLLAHELTHVVQQMNAGESHAGSRNEKCFPSSSHEIGGMLQRQTAHEEATGRQKIRKIILDKKQKMKIYELEDRYERIPLMDHCNPEQGNYTAHIRSDPLRPGKLKWVTDQKIGCTDDKGYILKAVEPSKYGTLEGVESIEFEVRDDEKKAAAETAIRKFFTTDKSPIASDEDLEKVANAEYILEKAGVTEDELLLLEKQQAEARENGQPFDEAEDPATWAAMFVQERKEAGEKALENRSRIISDRSQLDQWSQDDKNGIKNVAEGHLGEEVMHSILRRHGMSYYPLMWQFESELKSITKAFLSQAQIALFHIENKYLADKNIGNEEERLREAIEKIRPAMAQRDAAAKERDRRKNKATLYGTLPFLASDDPEVAEAEDEVKTKDEELQRQAAVAGLPVVSWKGFGWDAIQGGDIERGRSALRQFVAHAHTQIRSAQRRVESLKTLYKADRMVELTKAAIGIKKGSVYDDLITYRVSIETSDDGFWSTLWDITTIALMFVPGNIGIALRLGAGIVDVTKALDEFVEEMALHNRGLKENAPSSLGVFLAVGGTLIDTQEMAKGVFKVIDTEASVATKTATKGASAESTVGHETGETIIKAGDDVTEQQAVKISTSEAQMPAQVKPSAMESAKMGSGPIPAKDSPDFGKKAGWKIEKQADEIAEKEIKNIGSATGEALNTDTANLLRRKPELRSALAENDLAAKALKHCSKICFPENVTPEQVRDLGEHLLSIQRTGPYNTFLINNYLYKNRDNLQKAINDIKQWKSSRELDDFLNAKRGRLPYMGEGKMRSEPIPVQQPISEFERRRGSTTRTGRSEKARHKNPLEGEAGHHGFPQYLGGKYEQELVNLPNDLHYLYHQEVDKVRMRPALPSSAISALAFQ
jgi:hypothetical protein